MTRIRSRERVMRAAIWLTWVAVACGRSGGRWGDHFDAVAGVDGDAPVGDGFAHEQPEQCHDVGGAGVGQPGLELFDEHFHRLAGDLVERDVAEAGQDVVAQVAVVGRPPGVAGDVAGFPDRHPRGQGDPAAGGVDVGVQGLFDVDLLAADLRRCFGGMP
jgi:hypothetical protein